MSQCPNAVRAEVETMPRELGIMMLSELTASVTERKDRQGRSTSGFRSHTRAGRLLRADKPK
jgi:hypothetical protein